MVEITISQEVYDIFVYEEFKTNMREAYRNDFLQDFTESSVIEDLKEYSADNLTEMVEDREILGKINEVLKTCTPIQRRRFELRYFKLLSYREIAEIENVNISNVQSTLQQLRKKFKKFFSK